MHVSSPEGWVTRNSKNNISIFGQLLAPQMGHQPGYSKHVGEVRIGEAVIVKQFHDGGHGCWGW
jgi:hypothetical protein